MFKKRTVFVFTLGWSMLDQLMQKPCYLPNSWHFKVPYVGVSAVFLVLLIKIIWILQIINAKLKNKLKMKRKKKVITIHYYAINYFIFSQWAEK